MKVGPKAFGALTALVSTIALAAPASAGLLCTYLGLCGGLTPTRSTPELDPSLLVGTVTVLVGGFLMLAERRRRN